jgi:hypothetical protein
MKVRKIAGWEEGRLTPAQVIASLKVQTHNSRSEKFQVRKGGLPPLQTCNYYSTTERERSDRSQDALSAWLVGIGRFAPVL